MLGTISQALCLVGILFTAFKALYAYIQRRWRRLEFIKLNNCKPAAASCLHHPWLMGVDYMMEQTVSVLEHRFAQGIRESFNSLGTTYTGRILRKPFVATLDPANLETVMRTRFTDYDIIPGRSKLIRLLYGNGVFSTNGHAWKESRLLVKAGMSNFTYDPERLDHHATALISRLQEHQNLKIDFNQFILMYTIDVASDILFGRSTNVQSKAEQNFVDKEFVEDFTFLGQMGRFLTVMIMQIPYLAEVSFGQKYFQAQKRVFGYVDTCVDEAMRRRDVQSIATDSIAAQPLKCGSIVDGIVRRTSDTERVRSELLNLLLAGHDTVGIALGELFYCLARNPRVWKRLREEVATMLNGRLPAQVDLKRMIYLSWVINEAIRVRPTLSVHARRANRDTVLPRGGGINGEEPLFVEKNQYVVYSNYALYRNPAVFGEDVDTFRPERWETLKPQKFEYLNFGAGPRSCPGKEMGWTMMAFLIVRLAQEVEEVLPMDDRPWQEAKSFSFHNRHGIHLAFKMTA